MADEHGGEELPPRDHAGCLIAAARVGCGMMLLQVLMALAILGVAIFAILFFR